MNIKRKDNIVARKIHGSIFLINIFDNYKGNKCAIYEINETGMFIWENIDKEKNISELAILLRDEVDCAVEYQLIYDDVKEFIDTLVDRNFVEVMKHG